VAKKIIGVLLILSGIGLLAGALAGKETSENLIYSILFIGGGVILISLKNNTQKEV
jgi:Na+/H+ antiporter NhaC